MAAAAFRTHFRLTDTKSGNVSCWSAPIRGYINRATPLDGATLTHLPPLPRHSSPILPVTATLTPHRSCDGGRALLADLSMARPKRTAPRESSGRGRGTTPSGLRRTRSVRLNQPSAQSASPPPTATLPYAHDDGRLGRKRCRAHGGLQSCDLLPHQGCTCVLQPRDRGSGNNRSTPPPAYDITSKWRKRSN